VFSQIWKNSLRFSCRFSFLARGAARSAAAFGISAVLAAGLAAQSSTPRTDDEPFPDTEKLMAQVAKDQKKIESILSQYTFTDKTTVYTLDKNGKVRNQHTDTYYITPNAYEFFTLHVNHDGKALSQHDIEEQEKKIEKRMKEDERNAQKNEEVHPKDQMLFADIIARSKFTPVRWEEIHGLRTIVYAFEPKSASLPKGSLNDRIAGDLRGKMWISPEEQEIVRIEFASVSSLSLGMGFLGNVKGFEGYTEQQKIHGEIWMPTRQEFVARGRQLISGFHICQVDEFSDYLKATTDVFQQVHLPTTSSAQPAPQEE
jgi:hypothetical protein